MFLLVFRKLFSGIGSTLFYSFFHAQVGDQGLESQRESLRLAVLELPGRQTSMQLEKFVLPAVMLDLPLARHLAAGVLVRRLTVLFVKQLLKALGYFVAEQSYPILDQLVLLLVGVSEVELFDTVVDFYFKF